MSADLEIIRDNFGKFGAAFFSICAAALLALSRLLVKREVKRIDDRHAVLDKASTDLEIRVRSVEGRLATKDDIHEVFARMNAIGDRSEQRHTEIMNLIISKMGS